MEDKIVIKLWTLAWKNLMLFYYAFIIFFALTIMSTLNEFPEATELLYDCLSFQCSFYYYVALFVA